jgi:ATP-dependent DNA ligase
LRTSAIAKELKVSDTILDGEIVALDGVGKLAFYGLMTAAAACLVCSKLRTLSPTKTIHPFCEMYE